MSGETLIAVLPMYDFPWTAAANDTLWAAISARLAEAGVQSPTRLTRGGELAVLWRHPGLIFGQTCGYPYASGLKDAVTLIAAPEYSFPGCEDASHRSFIIRRASDPRRVLKEFRGAVAALNAHDSNTGMNLFRAMIAPIAGGAAFFSSIVVTGSHEASVAAVDDGQADLASIDCVSFALLGRGRPELIERVAIVAESPLSPCLPFIAAASLPVSMIAAVRKALIAALADPDLAETRTALGLVAARVLVQPGYERVLAFERAAIAAGYPKLAQPRKPFVALRGRPMTSWIESQSSPVIAAIVFGLVYLAAAAIFLLAAWVSRFRSATKWDSLTPALLSPLGTILGILIVFLAARVWANLDRAHEYVIHEISALREAGLDRQIFAAERRRAGSRRSQGARRVRGVRGMAGDGRPSGGPQDAGDTPRSRDDTLLAFSPAAEKQELAQSRALAAIENAFENRRVPDRDQPYGDRLD